MSSAAPILIASRLLSASRVALAADNTDVVDFDKANDFIVAFQIDEEKGPWSVDYRIRWRNVTDSGSFILLTTPGQQLYVMADTDLVDSNAVTIGEKACSATGGSGSTWQDGKEAEYGSSGSFSLDDEYYTEFHFAVSAANALDGKQYEFQLYDYTNAAAIGTAAAKITMAAGGPSDTPRTPTIGTATLTGSAPRNDRGIFVPTEIDV